MPSEDREKVRPFFNEDRVMRVAVLLSTNGSTADSLGAYVQEQTPEKCGSEVVLYFANKKKDCGVFRIGEKYKTPAIAISTSFLGVKEPERELNSILADRLTAYNVDVVAMMGAGWIVDEQIYDSWLTINNHPADLRVKGPDGKKAYKGWQEEPITKALLAGERYLHVTVNEADEEADEGLPWMISDGVKVTESPEEVQELAKDEKKLIARAGEYQDMLKEVGDKKIMARTLELIAKKRFGFDAHGGLCFDCHGPLTKGVEYKNTFR